MRTREREMSLDPDSKMEAVLDLFVDGRCTTGYLVEATGYSRPTVTKRLDKLRAADHVEYVHKPTALQELVDDPRE